MGGSVALAVRYESGETICFAAFTNSLSNDLKRRAVLVDKNEAYMRSLVAEFMAIEDCGEIPLAPMGYGINVIDFQRNHFLTMQGHANFKNFSDTEIMGRVAPDRYLNFLHLCDAGHIEMRRMDLVSKGDPCVTLARVKDAEEGEFISKAINAQFNKYLGDRAGQQTYYDAKIVDTPLAILEYPEKKKGAAAMKRKMKSLGFVIDAEANKLWNDFHEY